MKPIYGYVRVSTEEQSVEGVSIEAQKERIEAYCKLHGLELGGLIEDRAVSGSIDLDQRAGGSALVDLIRSKQCSGVVAAKLDRIFRSAVDALQNIEIWDKKGVSLHLIDFGGSAIDTGSAMGRMFITMMAGFAEFERRIIGERTSVAMQHMRKTHQYTGGEPRFGYDAVNGSLVENDAEQAILGKIHAYRQEGLSIRGIVKVLAEAGILTRKGRPFSVQGVHQTIQGNKPS